MILAKVRKRAYMLDCSLFNFLGQRFGWGSVIGLIPVAGDGLDGAMALLLVYWTCTKVTGGLPAATHLAMLFNIALDFLVGLIPFLGDLFDAAFKANTRNVRVLEKVLDRRYKPKQLLEAEDRLRRERRASGLRYESPPPATVLEYVDDDDDYDERAGHSSNGQRADVARPPPAAARAETRGGPPPDRRPSKRSGGGGGGGGGRGGNGGGGRWYSGGSRRERQPDVEMAQRDQHNRR